MRLDMGERERERDRFSARSGALHRARVAERASELVKGSALPTGPLGGKIRLVERNAEVNIICGVVGEGGRKSVD